jgi:methionine-rich copper-binding protein CopC
MKTSFLTPLITAFCFAVSGGPLWAHAHLESTQPLNGDHLKTSPDMISIRFGSAVEPALSKIVLTDGGDQLVTTGLVESSDDAKALFVKPTAPLKPGDYQVRWSALSHDGHPISGDFSFTVSK